MSDDELLILCDDHEDNGHPKSRQEINANPWRILVVDDDQDIHNVTRFSLDRFYFEGRPINVLGALSAREAKHTLQKNLDIALILLDVVMEEDDAGLQLVRWVREDLNNKMVRIILRTGQPGYAPAIRVITDYDINDYRSKTELTQERLISCIVLALRSYKQLRMQDDIKNGMSRIIDATVGMFKSNHLHRFLEFSLSQLLDMVGTRDGVVFCARQRDHVTLQDETVVVSGFGRYAADISRPIPSVLTAEEVAAIESVIAGHASVFEPHQTLLHLGATGRWSGALMIPVGIPERSAMRKIVELFRMVMKEALENFYLLEELRRSNKATVVALADLAEHRDSETGEHVLRVARLSSEIARQLKRKSVYTDHIDDLFLEAIGWASMLHDIGKVGVPDQVLKKTGFLDADERILMETHARIGAQALDRARRVVASSRHLDLGWEIALNHHERFDGTGYPNRIKGEDIPLSARIAAVADVFDALTSPRIYKPAWRFEDAITYILERSGTHFDPVVVDAFQTVMTNWLVDVAIRWTPDMSVGNPHLDEDHRRLVKLVNQLASADGHRDRSMAESVLDELIQYTDMHFAREEDYMRRIGFNLLDNHKEKHAFLVEQLVTLRQKFFNGLPGRLNEDVIEFLSRWLSGHILIDDMRYRLFIEQRNDAGLYKSPSCRESYDYTNTIGDQAS